MEYQKKMFGGTLKDVDVKSGTVTGYFAGFGNVDSDGDMITPGAFKKSINERGPDGVNRIAHLLQHDTYQPLAKPHVLQEDSKGLYFESTIAGTTYGKDALLLYEAGVYNEHSVGFQTITSERMESGTGIYYELREVKLWEGSTVTWGANSETPFIGFKSAGKKQIGDRFDKLIKAIKIGTLTDETIHSIELEIRQIKALLTQEPSTDTLGDDEPLKIFTSRLNIL